MICAMEKKCWNVNATLYVDILLNSRKVPSLRPPEVSIFPITDGQIFRTDEKKRWSLKQTFATNFEKMTNIGQSFVSSFEEKSLGKIQSIQSIFSKPSIILQRHIFSHKFELLVED